MEKKKIILIVIAIMVFVLSLVLGLTSCKGQKKTADSELEEDSVNVLVAYFSATGNTKRG